MRVVFFILLLANAAALAYFLLQPHASGGEAHPPLRPEAVRIVAAAPAAAKAAPQCVAWRGLAPADVPRARAALTELGLGSRTTVIEEPEYWLNIPSLKNRAEAEQKLGELKALGVGEATVVEEGPGLFALSLGSFATREEAEAALKRLQERGVKSARVAERPLPRGLLVTEVSEALMDRLQQLAAEYGESALKPVPCPTS